MLGAGAAHFKALNPSASKSNFQPTSQTHRYNKFLVCARSPPQPTTMLQTALNPDPRIAMKNECDYIKEAEMTSKMRRLLEGDAFFGVPKVYPDLSTKRVLTTEMLKGVPIDQVAR